MSDPSVSERRIRPIQDAVAGANWKQALQLCDKWFKKGEKSDRFLALKAFVLVNHTEAAQHDRGQEEVLALCRRNPAITEPEAIYQLQDALKCLSLRDEEGPKLWERAVTAKQNDKDLYIRWLNQAVADSNWLSAQKATMGLRKSFPKDRNYEFWNIMMCHLIHMQHDLPEKDRMLFGTLAYRMITKAAEIIPTDQEEVLSPGRAISTPEEISLLAQVLNSTGRTAETLKLLQSNSLNMQSRIGKQDPQLVLSLLLESFEMSSQWDQTFTFCHGLLATPEYQSDDRIWILWLKAQTELQSESVRQQARELLDSVCSTRPIIRAAYMAKMKFLQDPKDESSDALLQTCKDYSEAFARKAFCFDDLKESLPQLNTAQLDDLKATCAQTSDSFGQLFSLKLSYSSFSPEVPKKDLLAFVPQALQVYENSLSGDSPCPETVILAVMAILRLAAMSDTKQSILFATILLQVARSKFEDYYLFTILLVQLQAHLGLFSLAMENFSKLSVKNMQWETVGHLMLTRISSLHPASTRNGDGGVDPLKAIDTGLTVLENADTSLIRGIREGLRFNSYSNIYNNVQMRSNIERSMNRQIYAVEERKLRRLLSLSEDTVLPPSAATLVDKRDFMYLPDYRPDDSELLANFRCGPLPKQGWIDAMAQFDHVTNCLKAELTAQSGLAQKAFEALKEAWSKLERSPSAQDITPELTDTEQANLECHVALAEAVVLAKEGSGGEQGTTVDSLLDRVKAWLSSSLEARKGQPPGSSLLATADADVRLPTWTDLHRSFSQLETLQAIGMLPGLLSAKGSKTSKSKQPKATAGVVVTTETLSELSTLAADLERAIHDDAKDLKDQVNAPGVLGRMVDLGMAREGGDFGGDVEGLLEKLCDEVTMETICGRLKESWEDALDGVLAVKIKIYK